MTDYLSNKIKFFQFLGVVFVLYIHSQLYDVQLSPLYPFMGVWSNWICRIFQPIYFGLSGFLFFQKVPSCFETSFFSSKFRKRIYTLVIPYVIVNLLIGTLVVLLWRYSWIHNPTSQYAINYLHGHSVFQYYFQYPAVGQLWFVRDLIIATSLTPFFYFIFRGNKWWSLIVFIIIALLSKDYLFSFLSYGIGCYIGINSINTSFKLRPCFLVFVLILYVFCLSLLIGDDISAFNGKMFLVSWCLFYILWVLYDHISMLQKLIQRRPVRILAKYGFFTYLFHDPWLSVLKSQLLPYYANNVIIQLFLFLFLPLITYLLGGGNRIYLRESRT